MDGKTPRGRLVPDWQAIIDKVAKLDHVLVQDLRPGDVLVVETRNHRYAFAVLDPARRRVEMTSDNPRFPGPTVGCLQGSLVSPYGSSLFMGRIAVGLCVAFSSPAFLPACPPEIALSPTRRVLLNGFPLLPLERPDDGQVH